MGVEVVEAPEETLVRVRGEGLVMEVDHLQAGLLRLAAQRLTFVTVDLSELRFISSLAMGVLVGFRRGVVRGGGRLRLLPAMQAPVREAFERARLLELFEVSEGPAVPPNGAAREASLMATDPR
jgi:anti-anti-sigma factor